MSLRRVESAASLDRPADGVAALISKVIAPGRLKDAASGTWLGHPLHPLLVALPIGAWSSATMLDLTTLRGSAAARRLVGLGVLAAIPTAAAGGSDWVDTSGAERRMGLVHAVGAWLSIGLYASSWRARRPGKHGGRLLAIAGGMTLAATGYLGGHLTYRYGVGVDTTAFQAGPQDWTDLGPDADVAEGAVRQFRVGDVALMVTRRGGQALRPCRSLQPSRRPAQRGRPGRRLHRVSLARVGVQRRGRFGSARAGVDSPADV